MFTTAGRDSLLAKMDADVSHVGLLTAITNWRTGSRHLKVPLDSMGI